MKRTVITLIFLCGMAFAANNTATIGSLPDSGPTLPATCNPPQLYFLTATTIGLNQCTAANTWTVVPLTGGTGSGVSAVSGDGTSNTGINCNASSTGAVTLALCSTFQIPTGATVATSPGASDNSTKVDTTAARTTAIANAIAAANPATSVLIATTASLTGTYVQVGGGVGDTFTLTATGATTIDGVTLTATGQPVLLKNQSTASQNGIYTVTVVGTTGVSTVFTRATDYDTPADVNNTGAIFVQSGTANILTSWLLTSQVTSIGSAGSALNYSQSSSNPANIVTAVSPGTGVAHFAGSTQQATSSAVVSGDVDSTVCSNAACGQNTTGTAANLSGTPTLPNGTLATTQTAGDNSTKLATTAYADLDKIWTMQNLTALTPTGTQFYPVNGVIVATTGTTTSVASTMPRAGTVDKLFVLLTAAEGAAATLAITVNKNGTPQAVTCTVGNSTTTCNDTAHSFNFAAGDSLNIQTVQSGTGTSQQIQMGVGYH